MISVTAAAHSFRRTSRSMGTHLKAFGSGRVALGSIEEDSDTFGKSRYFAHKQFDRPKNQLLSSIRRAFAKFFHIFLRFINALCPLVSLMVDVREWSEPKIVPKRTKRVAQNSIIDRLEDKLLLRIFKFCDAPTILNLEISCSRLYNLIHKHCNELPKVKKDQIKLHFDEGEVIVFSLDERKVPSRFVMPPIEHLGKYFRHLSTLSLFIRGMIPIETNPVLKRLSYYSLSASQIYFLWCEFDDFGAEQLKKLFVTNADTLSDIGFEICNPSEVVSDELIGHNLSKLISLRVWHESKICAISDNTLFRLADLYDSNTSCSLETLDVAGGSFTVGGVCALVAAWYNQKKPRSDIYISLHNCNFTQADIINQSTGIPLNFKRGLENRGYRLTLNIN